MFRTTLRRLLIKFRRNPYLDAHGYYGSFGRHRRYDQRYGAHPFLPYSLADILEQKMPRDCTVLVRSHGSTARWFVKSRHNVILGRRCRGNSPAASIRYVEDIANYECAPLDVLVWDHHLADSGWRQGVKALSPRGVAVVVFPDLRSSLEGEWCEMCEELAKRGMRMLRFQNPAPGRENLCAELWYPADNVLGI